MTQSFTASPESRRNNFDSGPLSWVMEEIREALNRSRAALFEAVAKGSEHSSTQLNHANTYLHQAHGALQIIDVDGATILTDAVEDILRRMMSGDISLNHTNIRVIEQAYLALTEYLQELLSGEQPQPMRLFAYYKELQELRGAERVHLADLFFPDLDNFAENLLASENVDENVPETPPNYNSLRNRFEKTLLSVLTSAEAPADLSAASAMCDIVSEIERTQSNRKMRKFWRVMHGFTEMMSASQTPSSLFTKQVCGRMNRQIKLLTQGSTNVSERLLSDALYCLAEDDQATPIASQVRDALHIEKIIPAHFEKKRYGQIDSVALGLAKSTLTQAKNAWNRAAKGDADSALSFSTLIKQLANACHQQGSQPLAKLLQAIESITAQSVPVNDKLGFEIATCLLFVENSLDHLSRLPDDFLQRVNALIERVKLVAAGEEPPQSAQWLDSLSQQSHQKRTVTLLATEMESGLRQVEKILDGYNIDQTKHAELANIDPILHQIAGVLSILGQEDAMQAVLHTQALIRNFHASDNSAGNDLSVRTIPDAITQNITALGFFVEMLPQHPESARSRFVFDKEQGILYANLLEKSTARPTATRSANPAYDPLLDDASKAPPAAPTQAPSQPRTSEAHASDEENDAELLEIFMSEAEEVLDFVKHALPEARNHRDDQNQLSTLRRSFHTLKGSGRMVGLTAFADAAYSIEQVMNLWLADARSGTTDLFALLDKAAEELGDWVNDLKTSGQSNRTPIPLSQAADRVKQGESFVYEDVVDGAVNLPSEQCGSQTPKESSAAHQDNGESNNLDCAVPEIPQQEPQHCANVIEFPLSPTASAGADDDMKRIGHLQISVPLYNIFVAEADDILRLLAQDFSEWRHEHQRAVSTRAIHAAHSLAGIAATVGFAALQEVAHALEIYLQTIECQPVTLTSKEFDILQQCVERMKQMLQQIAISELPQPQPELLQLLGNLQQMAATPAATAPTLVESDAFETVTTTRPFANRIEQLPETHDSKDESEAAEEFHDAVDPDLLPIFLEEGRDLLPQIGQELRNWQHIPDNSSGVPEILRQLHTAKGSARMAGAMGLGQHLHMMESRIEEILHSGTATTAVLEDLLTRHDYGMRIFDSLQNSGSERLPSYEPTESSSQITQPDENVTLSSTVSPASLASAVDELASKALATDQSAIAVVPVAKVRVRADVLDRLVNQAGEVSIARSKVENEVGTLRQSLTDLTDNLSRLRSQLREVEIQAESQIASRMAQSTDREFDPLEFDRYSRLQELTRMMTESVDDVASIQDSLTRTVAGATLDLENQAQITRALQQDLMQVRMVPFSSVSERLYQITRQTSKEVGKSINLDIRGTSVELDRGVLERMVGPLEHLLRNAVVHGIESRAARKAAGKSETGQLLVEVRQEGNEVVIQLSDDGQGLDLNRIRSKALASGLIPDDKDPSASELQELIFQSGFSTADEITEIAGRGVGMDVVRSEATSLGGRVGLSTEQGKGTTFTINLPLTLAVSAVVLMNAGDSTYAVPSALVEQVQQLRSSAVSSAYKDGGITWMGTRVPLYFLPALLGETSTSPAEHPYTPVLILKSGNDRVALHVDEIIGNREVVVKNIGPQLARMIGIVGATVLGSGNIVLILNPVPLAQRVPIKIKTQPDSQQTEVVEPRETTKSFAPDKNTLSDTPVIVADTRATNIASTTSDVHKKNIVMVVDDSLTVRRVTQRFLMREGYQVVLAKDGVDALEKLQDVKPDVMLVDIEMPRMDGFDLIRNVRSDSRIAQTPIIMITSRTASKHRNYAMELGANEYYGKPFQEQQLLESIKEFVGREKDEV